MEKSNFTEFLRVISLISKFFKSFDEIEIGLFVWFQIEEDPSLAPSSTTEGFQFDPNAEIPSEGFKF